MLKKSQVFDDKFASFFEFIQKNKLILILAIIILFGAYLRLNNFNDLLRFNADQVRDAQIIDAMHSGEEFPLYGPKAGGTKFKLGPAFYYLQYLSGTIFGFTPGGIALFIPILSVISIYLFYLLFKKMFSVNIALGLTFLYSISFYAIKYSHFAWNPNAIPFFLLAFFLIIIKILQQKHKYYDFILLGVIMGISIQLHTTLLILMPLTALVTLIIYYIKSKKIEILNMALLIFIILLLNSPSIYGDFINNGKNIQEFLAGSENKTGSGLSIFKNISSTFGFFLQGATYYLSGIEPQKNWINVLKLAKLKNITEIILFLSSLIIFIFGLVALFKNNFKKNLSSQKNITITVLSLFTSLSFILFVLIGNELNIRFFIILLFLPYLLLGIIAENINSLIASLPIKTFLFSLFISTIFALNLSIYLKTYNLADYTAPASAYGGISLGELNNICLNINNNLDKYSNAKKTAIVESFEFKKSLEYVCQKNNLKIESFPKDIPTDLELFFVIVENDNAQKNIQKYQEQSNLLNSTKINRFTLLTFKVNR